MEMWHCFCDKVDTKGLRYGSLMIMTDQDTFEAKVGWWGLDEVELYSLKISGAMLVLGRVDFGVMLESVPFLTSWFEWNITFSLFRFGGGHILKFLRHGFSTEASFGEGRTIFQKVMKCWKRNNCHMELRKIWMDHNM